MSEQRTYSMEEVAKMRAELSLVVTGDDADEFQARWGIPDNVRLDDFVKLQEEKFKPVKAPPTRATVGRIVHVYSKWWKGTRPGIVVGGPWGAPESQTANVNVFLDGCNDSDLLSQCRTSQAGNTLGSIPVRDPFTDEERAELFSKWEHWAEFPPRV